MTSYFASNAVGYTNTTISDNVLNSDNFTAAINLQINQTDVWQSFDTSSNGIASTFQFKGSSLDYVSANTIGIPAGVLTTTSPYWQSFIATVTGNISAILVSATDTTGNSQNCTFKLFSGTGIGGALLATTTISIPSGSTGGTAFFTDGIALTNANVYTWQIVPNLAGNNIQFAMNNIGTYVGGRTANGVGTAYLFTVYMYNPTIIRIYSGQGIVGSLLTTINNNYGFGDTTTNPIFNLSSASITLTNLKFYTVRITTTGVFSVDTDTFPSLFNGESSFGASINTGFKFYIGNLQFLQVKSGTQSLNLMVGSGVSSNPQNNTITFPNIQNDANVIYDEGTQNISGIKNFSNLYLTNNTPSYVGALFDYYEIFDSLFTFTGPWAAPQSCNGRFVRVGLVVFFQLAEILVISANNAAITGSTLIPSRFLSTSTGTGFIFEPIMVANNNNVNGLLTINIAARTIDIRLLDGSAFPIGNLVGWRLLSTYWIG